MGNGSDATAASAAFTKSSSKRLIFSFDNGKLLGQVASFLWKVSTSLVKTKPQKFLLLHEEGGGVANHTCSKPVVPIFMN